MSIILFVIQTNKWVYFWSIQLTYGGYSHIIDMSFNTVNHSYQRLTKHPGALLKLCLQYMVAALQDCFLPLQAVQHMESAGELVTQFEEEISAGLRQVCDNSPSAKIRYLVKPRSSFY